MLKSKNNLSNSNRGSVRNLSEMFDNYAVHSEFDSDKIKEAETKILYNPVVQSRKTLLKEEIHRKPLRDNKLNCKCDIKDLNQLESVHLVKSRRQLFENVDQSVSNDTKEKNIGKYVKSTPISAAWKGSKFENTSSTVSNSVNKHIAPDNRYQNISYSRVAKTDNEDDRNTELHKRTNQLQNSTTELHKPFDTENVINRTNETSTLGVTLRKKRRESNAGNHSEVSETYNTGKNLLLENGQIQGTDHSNYTSQRSDRRGHNGADIEGYRSYVIKSIIDAYNNESINVEGCMDEVINDEVERVEECVKEMIENESRKSVYALVLSHRFIKNLSKKAAKNKADNDDVESEMHIENVDHGDSLNVGRISDISLVLEDTKRQSEGLRYGSPDEEINNFGDPKLALNTTFLNLPDASEAENSAEESCAKSNLEHKVATSHEELNLGTVKNPDDINFKTETDTEKTSSCEETYSEDSCSDCVSNGSYNMVPAQNKDVVSDIDVDIGEPVLTNYHHFDQPDDESKHSETSKLGIAESNEECGAHKELVDSVNENMEYGEVNKFGKRKPKLSRFKRLELKRPKRNDTVTAKSNLNLNFVEYLASDENNDDEDMFGNMLFDGDEYCIEVINADHNVVLNQISLQRLCISNLLHETQENKEINGHEAENTENIVLADDEYLSEVQLEDDKSDNSSYDDSKCTQINTCVNILVEDTEDSPDSTKTETYYDQNDNPRIEKITQANDTLEILFHDQIMPLTPMTPTPQSTKQTLIIKEILETESTFLEGLRILVEDYIHYFRKNPWKVNDDIRHVFGNCEELYLESQKFYEDLTTCGCNAENVASTFLAHEKLFDLYVEYIRNKPKSQRYVKDDYHEIIQERHAQLNHIQHLDSYLLTPVQRLGRYILFMENLQKSYKTFDASTDTINKATDFLKSEMRRANTFVAADSIEKCPFDLTKKRAFLMKDSFTFKKKHRYVVFLFEEMVVFTVEHQLLSETYIYKDSIDMSDLNIRTTNDQPLVFHLRSFSKCRHYEESPYNFELEAASEKVKKHWVTVIEKLLWSQLHKFKAAQKATSLPNTYKKKRKPESPTSSTRGERKSVFYI